MAALLQCPRLVALPGDRSGRRERGFSVLEMMIALVILGVITSQMFVVLSTQKRGLTSEVRNLKSQGWNDAISSVQVN